MNGWTKERRERQAEAIRLWRPWERSTGPTTAEGKERVARNAWKGGHRSKLRELIRVVNDEIRAARDVLSSLK